MLTFPVPVPENASATAEIEGFLNAQGYTRIHRRENDPWRWSRTGCG